MFFETLDDLVPIAMRTGTSVFVVPREMEVKIPGALVLEPRDKAVIAIDDIRAVCSKLSTRQQKETLVLIRPAEKMRPEAANTLLKTLEQPNDKVHFVLVTDRPAELLPTILSRAALYILRPEADFLTKVQGEEPAKELARRLLTARGAALVTVASDITKQKDGVQQRSLEVLGIAVEMAYKSYFATQKPAFLEKIPKLIKAYEKIQRGGNIKLQIVANLC